MVERIKLVDEIITCSLLKFLFVLILKFQIVSTAKTRNTSTNHLCFTCIEPLVGYTDHSDSCKYLNMNSSLGLSFIKECNHHDSIKEYECRKLVISFRSVETYLRRDCVPKGSCSWKDKTQSMINTPVSDCVYTDERTQKLECIYCCDTPLCNRTISLYRLTRIQLISFLIIFFQLEKFCFLG